jgi:aryl-alcohol dehydrogenase-like predicted oxidoreductase
MLASSGVRALPEAGAMVTRPIPSSGEAVPVVGLGTARTFDVGADAEARAPLKEVLRLFFEAGGTLIDTSPMYGRAEEVVGDLLSELGQTDAAFIATKVWTPGLRRPVPQMRQSMEKLRRHRVDLMQVHNLVDWRANLRILRQWKAEGLFRYIGITHWNRSAHEDLALIMEAEPLDFVQLNYSLGERGAEDRLLPLAADKGIAVLVNRPFVKGALFRHVKGRALPGWAGELGCESWAQLFLKFVISHPAVTCVIPATAKPRHLIDNMRAGTGRLPSAPERARMAAFWGDV